MKTFLLFSAVLIAVQGAVPVPPPGWNPSGRLLLVPTPAHIENAPQSNNTQAAQEPQSDAGSDKESSRLVDMGEYYVLLPDGRLQMVTYRTAALLQQQQQEQQQEQEQQTPQQPQIAYYFQAQQQQQQQHYEQEEQQEEQQTPQQPQIAYYFQAQQKQQQQYTPEAQKSQKVQEVPAPVFKVDLVPFPISGSQFAQTKLELAPVKEESKSKPEDEADDEESAGFQANLQYREVKPISGPVYAYNPTPLVRILRSNQ